MIQYGVDHLLKYQLQTIFQFPHLVISLIRFKIIHHSTGSDLSFSDLFVSVSPLPFVARLMVSEMLSHHYVTLIAKLVESTLNVWSKFTYVYMYSF